MLKAIYPHQMIIQKLLNKDSSMCVRKQILLLCTVSEELHEVDTKKTREKAKKEEVMGSGMN